jgi:anti-sigma28 factor (negative regulator of flagellin synthesis)
MRTNGLKWDASVAGPDAAPSFAASDLSEEAVRMRRIELFRRAVAAGTYRVDSGAIADRLLERGTLDIDDER